MKNIKTMFKKVSSFLVVGGTTLFFARYASALDGSATSTAVSSFISTDADLGKTIERVMLWLLGVTFSIAVAFVIIGGFRYIASAGNDKQAEAAKEMITKAVVGLVIILLAYVIVSTINQILYGRAGGGGGGGVPGVGV